MLGGQNLLPFAVMWCHVHVETLFQKVSKLCWGARIDRYLQHVRAPCILRPSSGPRLAESSSDDGESDFRSEVPARLHVA